LKNWDLDIKNPNKQENEHEYTTGELVQLLESSFASSKILFEQLKKALN